MSETHEEILPAPVETASLTERQLIENFLIAKEEVETITKHLKDATKLRDDLEARIIKNLKDEEKTASAKYENLGHVCVIEGAAHASIQKGMQEAVQKYLIEIGREDIIKETISASTLSAYVRECLSQNKELPPGVTFYRPEWINFYAAK